MNEQARQRYPQQKHQQNTQKLFKDFFQNNQDLPNKGTPNTYVSPQRPPNNPDTSYKQSSYNSL